MYLELGGSLLLLQSPRPNANACRGQAPEPPVSADRRLHLDLVTLMLATDEADHLTKYVQHVMDSQRVRHFAFEPHVSAKLAPGAAPVSYP